MKCGYEDCQQEITDNNFTYKYFPEDKMHKPVHSHHLQVKKRKEADNVQPPKPDIAQKVFPVKEEDL